MMSRREPVAPYRVGIDLGSNSLGWSVLRLSRSGEPDYLLRLGVRVFSSGRNRKNGESLAVERHNARQQRRRRDRKLRRTQRLLTALREAGLFPTDPGEAQALKALNPYVLRLKGLSQQLEPFELGRAIFHLNQRRGFRSNRRTDRDEPAERGKIATRCAGVARQAAAERRGDRWGVSAFTTAERGRYQSPANWGRGEGDLRLLPGPCDDRTGVRPALGPSTFVSSKSLYCRRARSHPRNLAVPASTAPRRLREMFA